MHIMCPGFQDTFIYKKKNQSSSSKKETKQI